MKFLKSIFKPVSAVATVLTMLLCLLPVNSLKAATVAVGSNTELTAAITDAADGDTILLNDGFVGANAISIAVPSGKNLTIDGQGYILAQGNIQITGTSSANSLILKNIRFTSDVTNQAIYVATNVAVQLDNIDVNGRQGTPTVGYDGGAIGMAANARLTISNSSFINNSISASGYSGGAIAAKGFSGSLTINNSYFYGNKNLAVGTGQVGGEGGAIYIYAPTSSSVISINNSYFDSNEAVKNVASGKKKLADGGAIAVFNIVEGAKFTINNSTFANNIAGDDGGAVLIQTNSSIATGVEIKNSTFYKNISQGLDLTSDNGGAIQLYANGNPSSGYVALVQMTNNTFYQNQARYRGGAVASTGYSTNKSGAVMTNNLMVGNTSNSTSTIYKPYYNVSGGATNVNNGGNIGYDNGTANSIDETQDPIFGSFGTALHANLSQITAGSSYNTFIVPTLMIAPEGVGSADNGLSAALLATDQRGNSRSTTNSDIGAVEIGWVKFDANSGYYLGMPLQTAYDGSQYLIEGTDALVGKVVIDYEISTINGSVSEPAKVAYKDSTTDSVTGKVTNYTFVGWTETPHAPVATQAEADQLVLSSTALNAILTQVSSGKTLYALYRAGAQYTVTYHGNGNTAGSDPVDIESPYDQSSLVSVLDQGTLVKDGSTFAGWNTSSDGSGTNYSAGAEFTIASDVDLYAQWTINPVQEGQVTVHYVDQNGVTLQDSIILSGAVGSAYSTEQVAIAGYSLDHVAGQPSGTFAIAAQEVTYVYIADGKPVQEGQVTVHYVDVTGKPLGADVVLRGTIGTNYASTALSFTNYRLLRIEGSSTGTFAAAHLEVTYVYEADSSLPNTGVESNQSIIALSLVLLGGLLILSKRFMARKK